MFRFHAAQIFLGVGILTLPTAFGQDFQSNSTHLKMLAVGSTCCNPWLHCDVDPAVSHLAMELNQYPPITSHAIDTWIHATRAFIPGKLMFRVQTVGGVIFSSPARLPGRASFVLGALKSQGCVPDMDFVVWTHDGPGPGFVWRPKGTNQTYTIPILSSEGSHSISQKRIVVPPRSTSMLGPDKRQMQRVRFGATLPARRVFRKAVWRGSTTGHGYAPLASAGRSKLVNLSLQHPDILDARFTGCVQRKNCTMLAKAGMIGNRLSLEDQARLYPIAVVVDGNSLADRLPAQMLMQAIALQEPSATEFWYSELLPWKHVIPVKRDLSDLVPNLQIALANASLIRCSFRVAGPNVVGTEFANLAASSSIGINVHSESIYMAGRDLILSKLSERHVRCYWALVFNILSSNTLKPINISQDASKRNTVHSTSRCRR